MNRYLLLCTLLAAIGSGVMAGFFYGFSNVVMGALRRIPAPSGTAVIAPLYIYKGASRPNVTSASEADA